jgi:hypothetical protein
MKIDWKRKLTSRKFWMSLASFISMLLIFFKYSKTTASEVASLIMAGASVVAYIIGEGLADSSPYLIDDDDANEETEE